MPCPRLDVSPSEPSGRRTPEWPCVVLNHKVVGRVPAATGKSRILAPLPLSLLPGGPGTGSVFFNSPAGAGSTQHLHKN